MSRSLHVRANGLLHHVLEWTPDTPKHASRDRGLTGHADHASPAPGANVPTVLLVHGFMDVGGSWDLVAPHLARAGFRVLAPDLRGFGDTERAPEGSYYHFADYVADVAALVDALCGEAPFDLVGHSMGGTVTTLYAGAHPERLAHLALLEGFGPPDNSATVAPARMRRWLDDLRKHRAASSSPGYERARSFATLDEALVRLQWNHPAVPDAVLRSRLVHMVKPVEGGRFAWRFDELHRTTSPTPFRADTHRAFIARVACPVLAVSGGADGFHVEDEEKRIETFADVARAELPGAGHMMHWTQPDRLAELLLAFFTRQRARHSDLAR
ncbi:alpha/beta fold hydrolase [Pendulispora albinea]|uniref:Alpha/beta hydrolase n=1 Tax=Pendulispora albinea TaxID=2741071 RepID=A0ABZ2M9W6_9BACT